MKSNLLFYKFISFIFLILSAGIVYLTFKIAPNIGGFVYQIGLLLFIISILIWSKLFDKVKKLKEIEFLAKSWPYAYEKRINFNKVYKFYQDFGPDSLNEKNYSNIDEQTAHDLNIDSLFNEISICSSTPGEQMLYYLLRTPKNNISDLKDRNKIIERLNENEKLRLNIQQILSDLGHEKKGDVFKLFNTTTIVNKFKVFIFNLLALISLLILIAYFIVGYKYTAQFLVVFILFMLISMRLSAEIENELSSLQYLGNLIRAGKSIAALEDDVLNDYLLKIKEKTYILSKIDSKTKYIYTSNELDIFTETLNGFFLTKIRSYYSIIDIIKSNRQDLIELYSLIGFLEAYISIASYRNILPNYSLPKFIDKTNKILSIKNAIHPLVNNCVPNSITLDNKGLILTGSNMSGKSTFMRTLGVNILLSQTIYTCCCENYEASFFNIMSSLNLSDDILTGKSYYLEECNSILRILNSLDNDITTFCIIDEIFRGTNPKERIATSKEILKYILNGNALAIVATHDLELAEKCSSNYLNYYFCEDVNEEIGLVFDYKLKPGICNTGNAIKLLNYLGYPKNIILNSISEINKNN